MIKLDNIVINKDGTLTVPKETYKAVAAAARLKYNFKGTSVRTVKKYVAQYLEEVFSEYLEQAFSEHFVVVSHEFLPKKKED